MMAVVVALQRSEPSLAQDALYLFLSCHAFLFLEPPQLSGHVFAEYREFVGGRRSAGPSGQSFAPAGDPPFRGSPRVSHGPRARAGGRTRRILSMDYFVDFYISVVGTFRLNYDIIRVDGVRLDFRSVQTVVFRQIILKRNEQ